MGLRDTGFRGDDLDTRAVEAIRSLGASNYETFLRVDAAAPAGLLDLYDAIGGTTDEVVNVLMMLAELRLVERSRDGSNLTIRLTPVGTRVAAILTAANRGGE